MGLMWEFLPSLDFPREYRVATIIDGKPFFLSGLGDGFRYATQIIGKMLITDSAGVFIEEMESNQHPESIKKIIPIIVHLSKKNRLQVFITTHNPNLVWTCFEKEFPTEQERTENFRCYHVTRNDKDGKVNCRMQTRENYDEFWSDVQKDMFGSS